MVSILSHRLACISELTEGLKYNRNAKENTFFLSLASYLKFCNGKPALTDGVGCRGSQSCCNRQGIWREKGCCGAESELTVMIVFVLQVDLGVPKMVRGIITQGARGLEGSTSAENRAFVRKYKLAHSLTGKEWTHITDSKTGFAKVTEGEPCLSDTYICTSLSLIVSVSSPSFVVHL